MMTVDRINELIVSTERIGLVDGFAIGKAGCIFGKIVVETGIEGKELLWDVEISPAYPFKVMGSEPIRFRNKDLLEYPHIMQDGSLCMHSADYENPDNQFIHDLELLKEWIDKYYVRGEKDAHYEHLVATSFPINDEFYTYCFTETQEDFAKDDYGLVHYAELLKGRKCERIVNNFVVQEFVSYKQVKKRTISCKINQFYQKQLSHDGVYCLLNDAPSVHNKFIIEDYGAIKEFFSQSQKNFIRDFTRTHKGKVEHFPLFCGYRIPGGLIHWQATMVFMDKLPIEPIRIGTGKNRIWYTDFKSGEIQWVATENISYEYFFGRGAMPENLAKKKVLIMGVGAIGSIVAETLTRCGAKSITLYDIDDKEPGNVCRSTYSFLAGITEKTFEMENILTMISPHIECIRKGPIVDLIVKFYASENENKQILADFFDEYDIVIDCTTDNQLMRVIDASGTKATVVNLSITNHAQELICAFSPNVTETVLFIYKLLSCNIKDDLYNPTGCWNPTFKASYNDISSKVQFAVKHIIKMLSGEELTNSFYITEDDSNLKIHRL